MLSKNIITFTVPILLLILLWNDIPRLLLIFNKQKSEGYESYSKCIKQGYPNKFCLNVPVEACIDNCNLKKWKPKY